MTSQNRCFYWYGRDIIGKTRPKWNGLSENMFEKAELLDQVGVESSREANEVRQFVTRVWEHPLVDETTRRHREQAKQKLSDILQKYGIGCGTFITVPVGSLIWAAGEQSDFDYQLVFRSRESSENAYDIFKKNRPYLQEELKKERVHIVANFPCSADYYIENAAHCANFFFTPDEYIGGDVNLAKELRLKAVQMVERDNYSQKDWESVVGSRFDIFFRKWDDLSVHLSWRYKSEKEDVKRDRTRRIEERLKLRANQTHKPKSYIATFDRSRNEMKIPNLETYSQAIKNTSGSLTLVQRFEAVGIDPNLEIRNKFSIKGLLRRVAGQ